MTTDQGHGACGRVRGLVVNLRVSMEILLLTNNHIVRSPLRAQGREWRGRGTAAARGARDEGGAPAV